MDRSPVQRAESTEARGSREEPLHPRTLALLIPHIDQQLRAVGLMRADVEDIRQLVLEEYLRKVATIREPRAWVVTVARRMAWSLQRTSARRRRSLEIHFSAEPTESQGELVFDVRRIWAGLSHHQRKILSLRLLEGRTIPRVAGTVGLSESTTKREIQRVLKVSRLRFRDFDDGTRRRRAAE